MAMLSLFKCAYVGTGAVAPVRARGCACARARVCFVYVFCVYVSCEHLSSTQRGELENELLHNSPLVLRAHARVQAIQPLRIKALWLG